MKKKLLMLLALFYSITVYNQEISITNSKIIFKPIEPITLANLAGNSIFGDSLQLKVIINFNTIENIDSIYITMVDTLGNLNRTLKFKIDGNQSSDFQHSRIGNSIILSIPSYFYYRKPEFALRIKTIGEITKDFQLN